MSRIKEILAQRTKHAVSEVDDHEGMGRDLANVDTLIGSLDRNPFGDLQVAPEDYLDGTGNRDLAKRIQNGEDW